MVTGPNPTAIHPTLADQPSRATPTPGATAEEQPARDDTFAQDSSVQHAEWGHGVVMSIEHDRLTVLFDDVGYKTLSLPAVHVHNLLTPG